MRHYNKNWFGFVALAFWLGAVFVLAACGDSEREPIEARSNPAPEVSVPALALTFGLYTSDSATEMVKQFAPILEVLDADLSELLGESVRTSLRVASTYEGGVDDLVSGRVDFARMGPASYVMAKELNQGIRIIAIESKRGSKIFQGVLCVHLDSPIQNVDDLSGERFAFGDSRSTIGRFLAQQLLVEHGIRADDLAGFDFLGRHDKVGMAVARKKYAAGALKESTFKKLVAAGEPIRAIASFPNVTKPWIARAGMNPEVIAAIRDALLGMDDASALKALKKDGFMIGVDADYDPIREAIQSSRLFDS
jgi:phosphonate transport system substrate-binding protein